MRMSKTENCWVIGIILIGVGVVIALLSVVMGFNGINNMLATKNPDVGLATYSNWSFMLIISIGSGIAGLVSFAVGALLDGR